MVIQVIDFGGNQKRVRLPIDHQ